MAAPAFTHVELLTLAGPEYRRVSTAPTRPATADEIPVIDLEGVWWHSRGALGSAQDEASAQEAKARIAAAIRAAATGAGFFYVTNHGIPAAVVTAARDHAQRFFALPLADKMRVHSRLDPLGNGYSPVRSAQINRSETKGTFLFSFSFAFSFSFLPLFL